MIVLVDVSIDKVQHLIFQLNISFPGEPDSGIDRRAKNLICEHLGNEAGWALWAAYTNKRGAEQQQRAEAIARGETNTAAIHPQAGRAANRRALQELQAGWWDAVADPEVRARVDAGHRAAGIVCLWPDELTPQR